jgi:hypothetical protein
MNHVVKYFGERMTVSEAITYGATSNLPYNDSQSLPSMEGNNRKKVFLH